MSHDIQDATSLMASNNPRSRGVPPVLGCPTPNVRYTAVATTAVSLLNVLHNSFTRV